MKRVPVSSINLSSVGYNKSNQVLEIEFNGGRVYQYFDVPKRIHQELRMLLRTGNTPIGIWKTTIATIRLNNAH